MTEVIDWFVCTISEDNIHIQDSYKCTDRVRMSSILYAIQYKHPECKVFEVRKWDNLIAEWVAHNRLYKWGFRKEQTGSVDLDSYEPLWRRILYTIIGI